MKQIFIPNMTYDENKLQNIQKKTDKFVLGLSSTGSFQISANKVIRIHENVEKSYCIENMFINEITRSFHSTNYLPLDIVCLNITRETYYYDNICLCIEKLAQNLKKQNHRIWIEFHDDRADGNTTYDIISSFLSNLNV